jgi:cobalt-zinc-cadmium efflux system outer membrane protein
MAPTPRPGVAAIAVLLLCTVASAAGEPVTESDAIRLFLEQSPQARQIHWIEQSVAAEAQKGGRPSNLEIAYQIEDAAGVRDEFLTFQQELPINGRRGLVRESAEAAASAAGRAAEQDLRAAAAAVRASFYEVLYRESVADRLRHGAERLERIVAILAAREREGEGSGYDLLRAEQELDGIAIATSKAEAALSVARARFGAFFDPERHMESARLEGDLEPADAPPEPEPAIELALAQRGDLTALRTDVQRLDLERRAARRRRFPEPTLTAGWKRVEALGLDDTGFIASLTVPLPIFERGQVAAAQASADLERVALGVEILEREIRADVQAALARERAAREAAERHGGEIERRAEELRRIAELAYEEGEAGILELLDAHRASLATELRALAVRYEVKRAEIERDRAIGAEVRP